MAEPVELVDRLDVRHCDVGDRHDGVGRVDDIVERDQIGATNKELFAYVLSFPIYMFSYVPISFQAMFAKSEWKPIEHKG